MRAADASSSSITRSRSPARSPVERSMMRYCIGLVSGTRNLREKLFDQRERRAFVPGALAEHPIAYAPFRIHHEGHRQAAHLPILGYFLLRIEQGWKRETLA